MAEYIEREAAIRVVNGQSSLTMTRSSLIDSISKLPAADVSPVVHGRWEWFEDWYPSTPDHPMECEDCGWMCGECKTALEDIVGGCWDDPYDEPKLNYCPNCGAKMDGGDSDEAD